MKMKFIAVGVIALVLGFNAGWELAQIKAKPKINGFPLAEYHLEPQVGDCATFVWRKCEHFAVGIQQQ